MSIKQFLKTNKLTHRLYVTLKNIRDKRVEKNKLKTKYKFANRSIDSKKLCIILAGYKPFLYSCVFGRIKKYIPKDIDVCVVSSGLYSDELAKISEENNWSYLSTKRNNVSVVQNLAVTLHPQAEFIYKLDEDIFVTENYFETLYDTYLRVKDEGDYKIGLVAPLIPINGYGHYRILKRLNLVEQYTRLFEKPKYAAGWDRQIEGNPEVAKYFWGEMPNSVPGIDEINKLVQSDPFNYSVCPIRFSIGAILFTREVWQDMGKFPVSKGSSMGVDEEHLCSYAMKSSGAIIVSENTAVGHFSFGPQNSAMKEYFNENKQKFEVR